MSFKSRWKDFWKLKETQNTNVSETIDLSELETPFERKLRLRGLWICHVVTFVFSLSFSIVFTGVFPYLQQVNLFPQIRKQLNGNYFLSMHKYAVIEYESLFSNLDSSWRRRSNRSKQIQLGCCAKSNWTSHFFTHSWFFGQ